MDINKTVAVVEKKMVMGKISSAIVVILAFSIVFLGLALVIAGIDYVQGFLSNTGTASIGMVDIKYSSASEKMQAIFLCTLNLASMALCTGVSIMLWNFFSQIAAKNKPFLLDQGNQLQKIAVLMMINALLYAICNPWAFALSIQPMPVIVLVWTFLLSLGGGLIYPLGFLCLAVIFNHGMRLQTESDETL